MTRHSPRARPRQYRCQKCSSVKLRWSHIVIAIDIGIRRRWSWPTICRLRGAQEYFGTNLLCAHSTDGQSLAYIDLVRPTMQQLQSCNSCMLTPSGYVTHTIVERTERLRLHKTGVTQGWIQDLEKGGSTVMYEAHEERNETRSASGVGGCGRVVSPFPSI